MLTPIEIQGITFKNGRGYKRDDVDSFMKALHHDYEIMYKENMELKEKVNTLSEGVQYYKNLEKTLQKALVLAEKTSEETKAAAIKNAESIEKEAKLKAEKIVCDARQEMHQMEVKTQELLQQFELYKLQYKQIINSQLELVNSSTFDIQRKKSDDKLLIQEKKKKEIQIPKAVQENRSEEKTVLQPKQESRKTDSKDEQVKKNVIQEDNVPVSHKSEEKSYKKYPDELKMQEQLASTIEQMEKETKEALPEKNISMEDAKQESAVTKTSKDEIEDQETDLEIKMLQKLLNEIKKNNEADTDEAEFEFIDTASDED